MAEVTNPRWAHNLAGVGWPSELQAKMKADDWAALTEAEWESVEDVIAQLRAPLLDGLLQLQPRWYEGELPIEAVAQMRIMVAKRNDAHARACCLDQSRIVGLLGTLGSVRRVAESRVRILLPFSCSQ